MTRQRLDDHVQDYYEAQSLRPELRQRLRGTTALPAERHRSRRPRKPLVWVTAAAVAALALVLWTPLAGAPVDGRSLANEIATNYGKGRDGSLRVESLDGLERELPELDFRVAEVERLAAIGATPRTARYCSLDGQIAVQVTAVGAAGERLLLYQAKADGGLAEVEEGRFEVGGLRVDLWQEDGVLIGLAGPATTE